MERSLRERARPLVVGLAALIVVALAGVLAAVPTVPVALVAVFLLGAPALAVALPWRTGDPLARAVVAVAVSLTLNGLVAELMLAAGVWSPSAGIAVVGAAAAALGVAVDLATHRTSRPRSAGTAVEGAR